MELTKSQMTLLIEVISQTQAPVMSDTTTMLREIIDILRAEIDKDE